MRAILVAAFALLSVSLLSVACAQPTGSDLTSASQELLDTVDGVTGGLPTDVVPQAPSKGPDLGAAFSAVGRFFADVAGAIGDGAIASATLVADGALAVSSALSNAVLATSDAAVTAMQAIGGATAVALQATAQGLAASSQAVASVSIATSRVLADGATLVARTVVDGAALVAAQLGALAGLYASLVGSLRPRKLPEPAFVAIVATGTAASATAAAVGLWEAIRRFGFLAGLPAVAGFSRIEDDELLKHPMRARVFSTIQANPGIHASELARRLDVGWGTIVHHLEKLQKGELVAIRKVNNQKCFFEMGGKVSRVDMAIAGAVRSDSASHIAAFVQSHPMTSQKALAGALNISPALASFHVKKLVHLGVLEKARRGKETLLSTTESLRRVLAGESGAVPQAPVLVAPMIQA
ncbi:MAG: helix-turn-helix domain-containing protein [Candidatus Thermoplasmatota archaeon]|mgnify:CR=1 FL=1